jgi:hypothetical protein
MRVVTHPFTTQEMTTMKPMMGALAGLGLVAVLANPAFAQGRGGFGRGFGGGLAGWLGNASVQKELKLDDQQVEKAKEVAQKIGDERRSKMEGFQDLSPEERREKMMTVTRELNETTMKQIGEFMKPEQIARLKQINYQQMGAMAFSDPDVIKKLNVTDTQKTDIQSIVQDQMSQMRTIFQENQDDPEARMKKMTELRKETLTKVTAKLNDEQQKSWKQLLGDAFEVKFEPRPNN